MGLQRGHGVASSGRLGLGGLEETGQAAVLHPCPPVCQPEPTSHHSVSSVPPCPHPGPQPVLPEPRNPPGACSLLVLAFLPHPAWSPPCLQILTTRVPQRCGLQGPVWAAPGLALTLPSLGPAGCCSRGLSDLSWFIAHILLVQNPSIRILRSIRRASKTGPSALPGAWSVPCPLKPWAESALVRSVYLCVGTCWWWGGTSLLSLRVCDTPEVSGGLCGLVPGPALLHPEVQLHKGLPVGLSRRLLQTPASAWLGPSLRSSLVLALRLPSGF